MKMLTEQLKSKHLKVTPQRLAIYRYLCQSKQHPSAEVIYKSLDDEYPTMSLATVYKTLDALKNADLIQEINVGEDSFRYDAATESHTHLICRHCHEVSDFYPPEGFVSMAAKIAEDTNFQVQREQLYFYGICGKCNDTIFNGKAE